MVSLSVPIWITNVADPRVRVCIVGDPLPTLVRLFIGERLDTSVAFAVAAFVGDEPVLAVVPLAAMAR